MTDRETRSGAQLVVDALLDAGVELVFGYPGGAIMPLHDALLDSPIRHELTRHEQAAVHAADGYARASGRLGVCIATSGPGATNLVTGICTAMADSSPVLCLTGQVTTPNIGTDAFQEADVLGIVSTVTKQSFLARSLHDLPELLAEAVYVAQSGRPGPVLVDLPKNVLSGKTGGRYAPVEAIPGYEPELNLDPADLRRAHALLKAARRPICIIGGGCKLSGATEAFRRWCAQTQIPVVATLNGIGATDPDYPGLLGMLGMHGLRRANRAVVDADLIIGLGMRFDDRVTGRVDAFASESQVIHVDIDAAEVGKIIPVDVGVCSDLAVALEGWVALLETDPVASSEDWRRQAFEPGEGLQAATQPKPGCVSTIGVLDALVPLIGPEAIVVTDVGQHQMWTAQRVRPAQPRNFITSGGAGTMGSALPLAIGAQLAYPDRPVVAVVGDGGFQMSLAELATIRRCNLPLKILVVDNNYLGMVRQWQEMFFDHRYSAVDLSDNPDFAELARVYRLEALRLDDAQTVAPQLERWWHYEGPALAHCVCQLEENVFPMVRPDGALDDMVEAV
ncbi:MAG: biosynthetic-type acetolactate synthase large subunit [bacterium]|nr:biosynthetic-type acetolactate synthase large subunit [bacterium]